MKYDPQKHHRRSIRLPHYDYSAPGAYFITMVTYQRDCLFGNIVNGEMKFSPMGQIAEEHWCLIPAHFRHVELGAYIGMPNQVHGTIIIHENGMAAKSSPQRQTVRSVVPSGRSLVPEAGTSRWSIQAGPVYLLSGERKPKAGVRRRLLLID